MIVVAAVSGKRRWDRRNALRLCLTRLAADPRHEPAGFFSADGSGLCSRTGSGMVVPEPEYAKEGFLDGDSLNPQKARILLQLALTKTHDLGEIQSMFHKY